MSVITNDLGEKIEEGYLGNLTPEHEKALQKFWERLFEIFNSKLEVSDEVDRKGGISAVAKGIVAESGDPKAAKKQANTESDPVSDCLNKYGGRYTRQGWLEFMLMDPADTCALRFLRARKYDVNAAIAMCVSAIMFRLDVNIVEIIGSGELGNKDVPGFLNQFRRGISYVRGTTVDECLPIYFIHVGRHFTNAQKPEVLQRFVVMAMENVRLLSTPPQEKAIIVFDMNGFGLKNMDWSCVMFILKCLESYYPESLRRIYVHGAPWIFKGVWAALQPLLDPVVAAKIKFSNKAHELEEYIPRSRFSKAMGGTMDWDWEYTEPKEGENELLKDTARRDAIFKEFSDLFDKFVDATRDWTNTSSKDTAYRRVVLMKQLRLKYYQLDPYIRARTVYHRNNIVRNDWLISWDYPQVSGEKEEQPVNEKHNVPALVKWLREHNEDTLEDSVGGSSPCMTVPTSYNVLDAPKPKSKKGSKSKSDAKEKPQSKGNDDNDDTEDAAGAAAGVGAGAAGAGAAGAATAAKRSKSKTKDSSKERGDETEVSNKEADPERRRRRSQTQPKKRSHRKSVPEITNGEGAAASSKRNVAEEPKAAAEDQGTEETNKPTTEPERGSDDQNGGSITGTAAGAAAAAATAATGALAAGAATLGLTRKDSEESFVSADGGHGPTSGPSPATGGTATGGANDRANVGDDDVEYEEELAAEDDEPQRVTDHSHDRELAEQYDLDDEERSILSDDDDSITPDTVLVPQYMSSKPDAKSVAITENDLYEDIDVCHHSLELFFASRMREAEDNCLRNASTRLYSSYGMALLNFVKSLMTFEPSDMQVAMKSCAHSNAIAKQLRKKTNAINKFVPGKKPTLQNMTLVERHAELVFAGSLLFRALLGVIYSGDTIGLVRQALNMRTALTVLRNMLQMTDQADSSKHLADATGFSQQSAVDDHLRSGVYFGNGVCMIILSLFPARLLRFVEGMGFSADRRKGLELLMRVGGWSKSQPKPSVSVEKEGIARSLCDVALLSYHLILAARIPVTDMDLAFADKVLSWNLQRYSQGTFFLYFSARLYAAQAIPEKAIEFYRNSIESQRDYKQLHHLCFWSLSLTYLSTCDFSRAYECYDVLSRESNWSKTIYQYAKAAMLYETNAGDREQSSAIMQSVVKLDRKVAGRHLPFEKFVRYKAQKFVAQHNKLPLPGLEFSYLWQCFSLTPVFLLVENTLTIIDNFIDELETVSPTSYGSSTAEYYSAYCLSFLLRGAALRNVAYPEPHSFVRHPANDNINSSEAAQDAVRSFEKVIELGSHLDAIDRYMVYFAHLELGRVRAAMGNDSAARYEFELILSRKPLVAQEKSLVRKPLRGDKANYLLSDLCQMQAHASRVILDAQRTRETVGSMSRSRSVRSSSTNKNSRAGAPTLHGATGLTRAETLGQQAQRSASSRSRGDLGSRARESRLYA